MEKGNLSSFPAFDTKKHCESNKQDNEIKTSVLNFKVTVKSIWVENNEAASDSISLFFYAPEYYYAQHLIFGGQK